MKVVFYTSTSYLDISLEIINILKKQVSLHVLIEITEGSKKKNIVNIKSLPNKILASPEEIIEKDDYKFFQPYFDGVESINFVIHSKPGYRSFVNVSFEVWRFIRLLKPDVFHLEALMVRAVGLIPSILMCHKLVISIHDPIPHSGERNRKQVLTTKLFSHLPKKKTFVFYSKYSKELFENYFQDYASRKSIVSMRSYSYYRLFSKKAQGDQSYILLFGRLSPYKGIEVLLKAMSQILIAFPDECLTIAGEAYNGYQIDETLIEKNKKNIRLINKHLETEELVSLIQNAKLVVCPYIDATQSGVIMTCYALGKPVVATSTGAFTEYVQEGTTGWLVPPRDHGQLAKVIISALENNCFKVVESNITNDDKLRDWSINTDVLLDAYLAR